MKLITIFCIAITISFSLAMADGVKVLSVSPDKKIEIITLLGKDQDSYENMRPHAKPRLLGSGIYARFVETNSPHSTLWSPDDSSVEAYIEWDSASTRALISQGDAKSWETELFILRKNNLTGTLSLDRAKLPALEPLLTKFTKISKEDKASIWHFSISDWKNAGSLTLSLHLDNAGWIAGKEGCQIKFHFATKDYLHFDLLKIDYTGVLPSESERWYDEGTPPYRDQIKTLYVSSDEAE
ncbi:hypothetical protein [Oceaniferula spumae]